MPQPQKPTKNGRYQELTRLVRERKFGEANALCEALLEEQPESLWLRRRHADILLKSGDTHRASRILQDLATEYPDDPRVLGLSGERHRLEGRLEEAIRYYRESLERREDPYFRVRLADGLIALKRLDEAERVVDAGLKRNPGDPYLLRRRARILAARGKTDEAANAYEQTATLAPSSGKDYADAIKLRLQELPAAERLEEIRALLSIPPQNHNPHLHALAAELASEQGDDQAARDHLRDALAHAGKDTVALKRIGFLYNRLGDYEKVLETLGPAFVEEPRDIVSQQVLFAAARKHGAWATLRSFLLLAYDRHPGFHKLNGLIKKVDKEMKRGHGG